MEKIKGRYELKHYINKIDLINIESKLKHIMKRDKNTDSKGRYLVRSLYFDNHNDKALMEKINGVDNREKFRIRYYNSSLDFIRLEKKAKIKGICYKQSVNISKEDCERLLNGDIDILKEKGDNLSMDLYSKMIYEQLRPKSIVQYDREVFIYEVGNVRVTFDYNIRTSQNVKDFLNPNYISVPIIDTRILEVKYDNFLPEVIRNMVNVSSRKSTSFSKYAASRII